MTRRDFMIQTASAVSSAGTRGARSAESDMEQVLTPHDIVYLTPVSCGADALPIGNGDLVAMVLPRSDGIEVIINKSDLWDDHPAEPKLAGDWAWDPAQEESWTALVSGARLRIQTPIPISDPLYLDSFEARLNLHDATVSINGASPLGKMAAEAWVSAVSHVLVIEYEESSTEPVVRELKLDRWGSRRLFHWFAQYDSTQTSVGLSGTMANRDNDYIWIEQRLRGIHFAVVARLVGSPLSSHVLTSHSVALRTSSAARLKCQIYLAIVTSEQDREPLSAARHAIREAIALGSADLLSSHRRHWAGFWGKSYVRIPDDYLENLYYFSLYQLAISSQGGYPPPHCGGLWSWNRDVRRWGHYYHWNLQQQYWPVHAANHPELQHPYFEFRSRTLLRAKEYATTIFERPGAFYCDVTDRWGRGTVHQNVTRVFTVGPQIAMDFWRHFLFTADVEFLKLRAYPVMRAVAEFYTDVLERDINGIYHIPRATAYENQLEQRDTITDLAAIRQFYPACIRASRTLNVDSELRRRWAEIVEHIAAFTVLHDAVKEDGTQLPPVFSSGVPLMDLRIGPDPNHHWQTQRWVRKEHRQFNISFFCEMAPVFPSGVVGIAQQGTSLYEAAVNTVTALGSGPAWNSLPIIGAARLGKGDLSLDLLMQMLRSFQLPPQGWFAEHSQPAEYSGNRHDMQQPRRVIGGELTANRSSLPSEWFDSPDLELGGVLMTGVQEMLLQSHDGVIRLFPAVPSPWRDGGFKLLAVGAFLITAELRGGQIQPCLIASLAGSDCEIESPWSEGLTVRDISSTVLVASGRGRVRFQTQIGTQYLAFPTGGSENLPSVPGHKAATRGPKRWENRWIGIPRQY
jgi:alpha-L-fucosidase 2